MALSNEAMQALLAPMPLQQQSKTNAWIKITPDPNKDHVSKIEQALVKPSDFGKYEGRAGTKVRSRKGRVRILPNGRRQYINAAYGGDVEVVAYRA